MGMTLGELLLFRYSMYCVIYMKSSVNMLYVMFGLVENKMTDNVVLHTVLITRPAKVRATVSSKVV